MDCRIVFYVRQHQWSLNILYNLTCCGILGMAKGGKHFGRRGGEFSLESAIDECLGVRATLGSR